MILKDEYADAIEKLASALEHSYEQIRQAHISEADFDYSYLVVNRLRAFYHSQLRTKEFLDKKIAQAGADFFVETILFGLKLFNDVNELGLEIKSEYTIRHNQNTIRPDISIWYGSELLAVVECKTQLGWRRHNWKPDFEHREKNIKEIFPNAKVFLVVMSTCNWPGFGNDEKVGKQLFCLLNIWPTEVSSPPAQSMLNTWLADKTLIGPINIGLHLEFNLLSLLPRLLA